MTTSEIDWPDPIAQAIRDVHTLGEELGFEKIRVDRSARLQFDRVTCYFEVGYGCKEIKVRTYFADGKSAGEYRCNADKVDMESVLDLLTDLLDRAPEVTRV